jgi:hypothetical protein
MMHPSKSKAILSLVGKPQQRGRQREAELVGCFKVELRTRISSASICSAASSFGAPETRHHCEENRTSKVLFRELDELVVRNGNNSRSQFRTLAKAAPNLRNCRAYCRLLIYLSNINDLLAERVGFEPTVRFPAHTLSKRAP